MPKIIRKKHQWRANRYDKTAKEFSREVGRTLLARRRKLKLSGVEVGHRAGMTHSQLSRLENGLQGLRLNTLFRLAGALEIPPERVCKGIFWIFGRKVNP